MEQGEAGHTQFTTLLLEGHDPSKRKHTHAEAAAVMPGGPRPSLDPAAAAKATAMPRPAQAAGTQPAVVRNVKQCVWCKEPILRGQAAVSVQGQGSCHKGECRELLRASLARGRDATISLLRPMLDRPKRSSSRTYTLFC